MNAKTSNQPIFNWNVEMLIISSSMNLFKSILEYETFSAKINISTNLTFETESIIKIEIIKYYNFLFEILKHI